MKMSAMPCCQPAIELLPLLILFFSHETSRQSAFTATPHSIVCLSHRGRRTSQAWPLFFHGLGLAAAATPEVFNTAASLGAWLAGKVTSLLRHWGSLSLSPSPSFHASRLRWRPPGATLFGNFLPSERWEERPATRPMS